MGNQSRRTREARKSRDRGMRAARQAPYPAQSRHSNPIPDPSTGTTHEGGFLFRPHPVAR